MIRTPSIRCLLLGLAAATALFMVNRPAARAAETLRWKFNEGEVLRYEVTQDMKQEFLANGNKVEMGINQIYDLRWTIDQVDSEGKAGVTFQFDRIRFKMNSAVINFEYDSDQADQVPDNPALKPIADTMGAMLGVRFTFKVDPLGNLTDMKGMDQLKELLPDGGGQFFTEDSLEQTASQGFVRFDRESIEPGGQWQKQYDLQMPQLGHIVGKENYTLAGEDTLDEKPCLRITSRSDVTITPDQDGQLAELGAKFEIEPIDSTYLFDNQAGHLLKSTSSQQMQIVANFGNVDMVMDVTVRLMPEKKGDG